MGRTLTLFVVLFITIYTTQITDTEDLTESNAGDGIGDFFTRLYVAFSDTLRNLFGEKDTEEPSKHLIIRDIGSNWVYLECNKGKADITCKTEDTTQPENFTIPANISLGAGKIYTCNITEGSGDCGITFELGAGNVTASSNTSIARFESEEGDCELSCVVKNNGTQTDTVWRLQNYMGERGLEEVPDGEIFEIFGDPRPRSNTNFGNRLKIQNCSSKKLNGTKVYCGSHMNHTQVHFDIEVCEEPVLVVNGTIWLEEGTKSCTVTVIQSPIELTHFRWQKDNEEVSDSEDLQFTEKGVTFNNVTRDDIGNYSLTANMSCHEHSTPKEVVGNFPLSVVYGPELTKADEVYSAREGDSVTLICGSDLKSNPSATISWTKPKGETVNSSERFTMNNGSEVVSLSITNVGKDDNGTWTCNVEVLRNEILYCSSEQENQQRIEHNQLQLIVVIPPSEPQNFRVVKVTCSSFRVCWYKPKYHGSSYLAGYDISYNDKHERIDVVGCFIFDSDRLEWRQTYSIAVSAVSEAGVRGSPSRSLILIMDRPAQLRVADISSSQVTLTWDKLSGVRQYSVTCNGTAQGAATTNISGVIFGLSQSTVYECTVLGSGSLRSFEVLFVPGAGSVTHLVPDNGTVISHFLSDGEKCELSCVVEYNGTQTDTVWSFMNGSAELKSIIGSHISGDYRPGSQSHYSNHLQIIDCSLQELDGVKVYCGSRINLKQAFVELKVCDLPQVMESNVTQIMEGTENCKITVVSTNLMANDISWEKDGESVREGVNRFTITFNNITRAVAGNYSVASSVVCHDDKTKPIAKQFALDVVYPPTMGQVGEGSHKVNETYKVTLICGYELQSNPQATIFWIDPDGNEVVDKENYFQDDGPGVVQLHIKRASRRDRGQWTCKMEVPDVNVCIYNCLDNEKLRQHGQQPQAECSRKSLTNSITTNLDVFYGPETKVENLTLQSSFMNETKTIICARGLESNPPATITWTNPEGDIVKNGTRYSYQYLIKGPADVTLTIFSVNEKDIGTWGCNISVKDGENEIGRMVMSIELGVDGIGHPIDYRRVVIIVITIIFGTAIMIIVMVPGQRSKIPRISKPKISNIFQDGIELTWTQPESDGQKVTSYVVLYHSETDPAGQQNTLETSGTKIRVKGLLPNTKYVFKVRAMSKEASGPESEESDPVTITKPQTSDKIIPIPYASQVTHNSVTLTWERLKNHVEGAQDNTITISYRASGDEDWQECTVKTDVNYASISELKPQTRYVFKLHLDRETGEHIVSNVSDPILTKSKEEDGVQTKKSLAEKLKSQSEPDYSHPHIYYPKLVEVDNNVATVSHKYIIAADPYKSIDEFHTTTNEKVLMLVGATGAGKSTLINGIANYIVGVRWEDKFRFKVIVDEGKRSQAQSQTNCITAYTFHNSSLPYSLTVIDTPGFGDTRGIERDKYIVEQIRALFSVGGIDQIHGVGFVTDASSARLTPTQKYIFESVLSIFGRDIASNIFLLTTYADAKEPPVLSAIKEAAIPYKAHFKFNNSALFVENSRSVSSFDKLFWVWGMESFEKFFRELERVEPHSLQLTRENLNERQNLEAVIEGLKMQIRVVLAKIDVLHQKQYILRKHESEILQNQHFTYEVTVSKQRRIEIPENVVVTNCNQCEFTCHYPCPISKDNEKYRCKAMDGGGPDSARCTVCPGNCPWSQHINATYRFETYYEIETQTSDDLKKNLFEAIEGKSQIESMIAGIEEELEMLRGVIVGMVSEAKRSLERLRISLLSLTH